MWSSWRPISACTARHSSGSLFARVSLENMASRAWSRRRVVYHAAPHEPRVAAAETPMSEDPEAKLRRGLRLDPAGAPFWDARYREQFTPWDAGGVPAALTRFLDATPVPLRVLIPGCGSAYEAREMAERGHEVLAIDFSELALQRARAYLG